MISATMISIILLGLVILLGILRCSMEFEIMRETCVEIQAPSHNFKQHPKKSKQHLKLQAKSQIQANFKIRSESQKSQQVASPSKRMEIRVAELIECCLCQVSAAAACPHCRPRSHALMAAAKVPTSARAVGQHLHIPEGPPTALATTALAKEV